MGKRDEWLTASVTTSPYVEFRSQWDLPSTDILLKESLIEGYIITEKVGGLVKLNIIWNGGQTMDGWLPASFID